VNSATWIKAKSPAGTGMVDVTVTTQGETSATSSADHFTYLPAVTAVLPSRGPVDGGTTVNITGVDFTGATAVQFGSTDAAGFTVNSDESITAVSPVEPVGRVHVRVTTSEGTSQISPGKDTFTFTPTVTGVSPNTGPPAGGRTVTVTGTGFALGETATVIKFGPRLALSVNCATTTECTASSPELSPGKEYVNPVDVRATVNRVVSPKAPADQFDYHGLYLLGERGRLRVGEGFTLRGRLYARETMNAMHLSRGA
jgi:hypothetical protein